MSVGAASEPGVMRASDGPSRLGRFATVAALAVGAYMAALNNSVVNAVLPVVADAFEADLSSIEWVVTIFLLVQGGLLLTFGRLGRPLGPQAGVPARPGAVRQ